MQQSSSICWSVLLGIKPMNCYSVLSVIQIIDCMLLLIALLSIRTWLGSDISGYYHEAYWGKTHLTFWLKLTQHHWCTALLEELETLVEQLDQQEAAKQLALRRAEAAERELEVLKAEKPQMAAVSAVLCLGCWCTMQLPGLDCLDCLIHVLWQPFIGLNDV